MSFICLITNGFEDACTCGCDKTDSVRYHLRANKIDLSLKTVVPTPLKKRGSILYCPFLQNKMHGLLVPFESLDTNSNIKLAGLSFSARRAAAARKDTQF